MKQFDKLEKRLALLEQKLDLLMDNHLSHLQSDMKLIKGFLGAVMLAVFVQLLMLIS